eukprot:TRINITY_DN4335_c0_g1_i1.p1 TRINITY_DN4335_c0_g1~~TRINITY_DN4335_c0_g1_i1.p1  ORF type:complete len:375 (-),score=61.10 TRINITY_DN4335_c0_g1_i1:491-1615(-)
MADLLLFLLVVPAAAAPGDAADLIRAGSRPESAVVSSDGYFVSAMQDGTITKYNFDGSIADGWKAVTGLTSPRGLAISSDSGTLFVASDSGVSQYTLSSTGATEEKVFDTATGGMTQPNGLCLNGAGSKLYATEPGWKAFPWGASGTSGLAEIDLTSGKVTMLFSGQSDQSPNGCSVAGETVWMASMKDGVTSYNTSTSTAVSTAAWSQDIKTAQTSASLAGDGLAIYAGKLYVSIWKPMPAGGKIFQCDMLNACTEFAALSAADIQVDAHVQSAPVLLAPDLMAGLIRAIQLPSDAPASSTSLAADNTSQALAPASSTSLAADNTSQAPAPASSTSLAADSTSQAPSPESTSDSFRLCAAVALPFVLALLNVL